MLSRDLDILLCVLKWQIELVVSTLKNMLHNFAVRSDDCLADVSVNVFFWTRRQDVAEITSGTDSVFFSPLARDTRNVTPLIHSTAAVALKHAARTSPGTVGALPGRGRGSVEDKRGGPAARLWSVE